MYIGPTNKVFTKSYIKDFIPIRGNISVVPSMTRNQQYRESEEITPCAGVGKK